MQNRGDVRLDYETLKTRKPARGTGQSGLSEIAKWTHLIDTNGVLSERTRVMAAAAAASATERGVTREGQRQDKRGRTESRAREMADGKASSRRGRRVKAGEWARWERSEVSIPALN
jgi:hypothetical protein